MVERSYPDTAEPIVFWYKNYRGETGYRRAIPISLRFGVSDWHKEPQWLLLGIDTDKEAEREFALKDISAVVGFPTISFGIPVHPSEQESLTERLRNPLWAHGNIPFESPQLEQEENLAAMHEAADEIERLRGVAQQQPELEDLRKANQILHILLTNQEWLLTDAQRIIAEYKASTIAGAKADVAAHGLPGARGRATPEWRLVDSAPHETYVLLGWWDEGKWNCQTGMASHGWRRGAYSTMSCHGQATHWQPLPDGPVVSSTDKTGAS